MRSSTQKSNERIAIPPNQESREEIEMKDFNDVINHLAKRKIRNRPAPNIKILDPSSDDDRDGPELFQA